MIAIEALKCCTKPEPEPEPEWNFKEKAFNEDYRSYRVNGRPKMDIETFFGQTRGKLIELIERELKTHNSMQIQMPMWIRFARDEDRVELAFNSRMTSVYRASDLNQIVDGMIAHMMTQIENPALLNSRLRFDEILFLDINFHWLNFTRGNSHLPLPDWLARKKAIINPQNKDDECFKWAVIAVLEWSNIKFNPECISNLMKFAGNYDWSGLKFPLAIKDINVFEMNNDISINVLSAENKDIYICRKGIRRDSEINLLLISEDGKLHYTAVKSLSRLLSSSNSKHKHKQYFCNNCLQGFTQELSRDQHYDYCINNETVRVEMLCKGSTVEFYDGQNQFRVPFMMYADFEAILEPFQSPNPDHNQPCAKGTAPMGPYTSKVNQHIPSGWCVYSKFMYGEVKDPLTIYRGKDCIEKFCDHIKQEAHRLYHMFPEKPLDPLTKKQWKRYEKASRCHICFKPFNSKDPKVRDHCHYTGHYRRPTHSPCNLRYRIPSYIPMVVHNLSGYDTHRFIKELGKCSKDIGVIAKNKEDYITFSANIMVVRYMDKEGNEKDKFIELQFIHSFKFMASSVDLLTNNLVKGGKKLFGFEDYSELQYNLLTKKGIYPYEYMSIWDCFKEVQLPPIEAFYSNLNMTNVSKDDYQHAQKVWKEFGIGNLGDYHNLYLRTDVILLANVFEAFRNTCLEHYKLDPVHFYTSPGLAWKACFRKT